MLLHQPNATCDTQILTVLSNNINVIGRRTIMKLMQILKQRYECMHFSSLFGWNTPARRKSGERLAFCSFQIMQFIFPWGMKEDCNSLLQMTPDTHVSFFSWVTFLHCSHIVSAVVVLMYNVCHLNASHLLKVSFKFLEFLQFLKCGITVRLYSLVLTNWSQD